MTTRRAFAQLLAAGLVSPSPAAPGSPRRTTAKGARPRSAEVLALRAFVEKTSPRGMEAAASAEWIRGWDHLHGQADVMGDGPYVIGLRRLMTWFKEGHTTIVPFEFLGTVPPALAGGVWGLRFPLKATPFHDGLWVTEASTEAGSLLGKRIRSISKQRIQQIMAEHVRSWPGENPAWAHNWAGLLASSAGTLHGLGVAQGSVGGPLAFEAESSDGLPTTMMISAQLENGLSLTKIARTTTRVEQIKAEMRVGNFIKPLPGALYISIDEMADLEGLPFAQFTNAILSAMRPETIGRLIIDLRRNGGGDNYLGEPLRHELARSRFNVPGGLCVLIGPATFSAAQNFANRLERECFAPFVGEPSGSAPNLVGDSSFFTGEATGITAMVATLRWFDGGPDDKRRWIFPDVFVPSYYADWLAGRDPALDTALSMAPVGTNTFASRARYFERESQKASWTPFWGTA
jgi:hypothetical protein